VLREGNIIEWVEAFVIYEGVIHTLGDDVEVVDSLWEWGGDIEIPVGGTISNHNTLKVDSL